MGREVRRIALDFKWPLNEVWSGYLSPKSIDPIQCDACESSGQNPETRQLSKDWYDHDNFGRLWWYDYKTGIDGKPAERAPWKVFGKTRRWQFDLDQAEVDHLIAEGRLHHYTDTWDAAQRKWVRDESKPWPTAERINHDMQFGMGHDSINHWICTEFRAKRLGVFGSCTHCDGVGHTFRDEAHKIASETWEPTDPPAGDGWQMWETTSEGSPISPVRETAEQLALWLVCNRASSFGGEIASFTQWMRMIKAGWAPSAVSGSNGTMQSGVAAAGGSEQVKPVTTFYRTGPNQGKATEYRFDSVFPQVDKDSPAVTEFVAWLNARGIEFDVMPWGEDVIVNGHVSEDDAFEFKTRWV